MINIIELTLIFLYLELISILYINNYIMILITIELIILSIVLLFSYSSYIFDDLIGLLYTLILLPIAGGESVIGLIFLVNYLPVRGHLMI